MRSVCVCGSKRFKSEIAKFCSQLSSNGVLVFEPSFDEPILEHESFQSAYVTKKIFKGLTLEHLDWVRKADICFVFNKDNYVGVSVTLEMAYACALGKPVIALNPFTGDPCRDGLIDKVAKTPLRLLEFLK